MFGWEWDNSNFIFSDPTQLGYPNSGLTTWILDWVLTNSPAFGPRPFDWLFFCQSGALTTKVYFPEPVYVWSISCLCVECVDFVKRQFLNNDVWSFNWVFDWRDVDIYKDDPTAYIKMTRPSEVLGFLLSYFSSRRWVNNPSPKFEHSSPFTFTI
jgi:hypothetical protein